MDKSECSVVGDMKVCFARVFYFKQKTAYDVRISDWSSDVCSSDLAAREAERFDQLLAGDVAARGEQRVLAPRIVVERRARHAEFARDILERRLAKAKIAEYVDRKSVV